MYTDPTEFGDSVSVGVVMAVAEREGTTPEELRPLPDVVDPDALDTLCTAGEISVTFPYKGYVVTVTAGESIHLEKRSRS
ncbi:HalOD1 output domain-containing protein [Saliphagus infecundisoli]|uniref:HalOD1 output domain-containing protein n=1 Tax=Saliphagus infecundisoli TaxID=1849069 RepID=A0ABD5QJG8_9EURY|nr:HalOD1 output domain-containing protein [Saliphagus infecundisoli]